MNKRDLIDAISSRMGDKKTATEAVNAVLDTIQVAVAKGDKVAITGFGVFEKSVRPARTARNPATGAAIKVPKTSVPKFRAGADFKAMVMGTRRWRRAASNPRHGGTPLGARRSSRVRGWRPPGAGVGACPHSAQRHGWPSSDARAAPEGQPCR
jgi:DNA-binding protein HU-beta